MRKKAVKARAMGPKTLEGSDQAKRQAVAVLEVLSGERTPTEGCAAMGVSLTRYYLLETRALQGLITALEPRPKGRRRSAEDRIGELEREKARLERELGRTQSLVRAAQRAVGLPGRREEAKESKLRGKKPTRKRRTTRAKQAIAALRGSVASSPAPGAGSEVQGCRPDARPTA